MNEKLSILLVEDDAEMRETLCDILLDKKDYVVKAVGTGKEGLALAKEEKFHICLIDLKLPDITGIEVLKGLKAINPETYAIIITAYASKEMVIEALKTGAYCYLEKPLDMEELFVTLERVSVACQLPEDNKSGRLDKSISEGKRSIVARGTPPSKEQFSGCVKSAQYASQTNHG